MINRNVVSEITPLELQAWKGPINYNTHHDVLKDSVTTPVRLVSNSSFPNGSTTLNDLLVKGPNTLNCLFSNLVRFRGYEIALVGDISKAYNSIKTGQVERHVRSFSFSFYLYFMTLSPMDCFLRHEKRLLDYGQRNSKLQDIVDYIIIVNFLYLVQGCYESHIQIYSSILLDFM